jgi:hypothetical protein
MATSIRGSQQVDSAFKKLVKRFAAAQKKINSSAAKKMKSGHYEDATKFMEIGKAFDTFLDKIESVRNEWRELLASSKKTLGETRTGAPDANPVQVGSRRDAALKAWSTRRDGGAGVKSKRNHKGISARELSVSALNAIAKRGGTATTDEILSDLHSHVVTAFPDSDLAAHIPLNHVPWRKIVRKTRKYIEGRGWIERTKGDHWKITDEGQSSATFKQPQA